MPEKLIPEITITAKALADLSNDELKDWEEIALESGADIYLTPNWIFTWATAKNKNTQILCLIASCGSRKVGYLPVAITKVWCGLLPVRIARLAGVDPNNIITHFPISGQAVADVFSAGTRRLLNEFHCDLVTFAPLSGEEESFKIITDTLAAQEDLSYEIAKSGVHTVFKLPKDMNEYLETKLTKKRRAEYRRNVAKLLAQHKLTHAVEEVDQKNLGEFVALHTKYWRGQGKGGHFSDWPEAQKIYQDLAIRTAGTNTLIISSLRSEGELIAAELAVVGFACAYWRLPARREGSELDALGIGKVSLILLIKNLIEEGVTWLEGGPGSYKYKIDSGAEEVSLMRVRVLKAGVLSQLKFSWFTGYADVVELVYYRAWFKKMRPKLGNRGLIRHRPLWRHWRETRF